MSVYIIAEAGVNHNGSLELAKKLVDAAVKCGADAVKFQTFKAEESTSSFALKAKYQKENVENSDSQFQMIKKLELPFNNFKILQQYCKSSNVDFISTPDGSESLKYLLGLDVPLIKIGSTEITNIAFLEEIGSSGKNIILSTGMSNLGEVERAINTILSTGNKNIILMHCTTDYPTEYKDVNIKAMITMKNAFNLPVGFSDHTIGIEAAIAAVALGAIVIEKHITLDTKLEGPDHKASMCVESFKAYVEAIRNTEKLLGDGIKCPTESEKEIMKAVRRSIVAKHSLAKGTILSIEMLTFKRPGSGLRPEYINFIIGRALNRNIEEDEIISLEDLN